MNNPTISLIAAIGKNRELGHGNKLIFKIPEDMKYFREKTRGHVVIMGRKTFESIGNLLPNRTNIIVTRDIASFLKSHPELRFNRSELVLESTPGSRIKSGMTRGIVVSSIEEALECGKKIELENYPLNDIRGSGDDNSHDVRTIMPEVFIIGGAQIYTLAMPYADKLYLTLVDAEVPDVDAFFPDYSEFKTVVSERRRSDENYVYSFIELSR